MEKLDEVDEPFGRWDLPKDIHGAMEDDIMAQGGCLSSRQLGVFRCG